MIHQSFKESSCCPRGYGAAVEHLAQHSDICDLILSYDIFVKISFKWDDKPLTLWLFMRTSQFIFLLKAQDNYREPLI